MIGIMGALPEETNQIKENMLIHKKERIGLNDYYTGQFCGTDIVLTTSGCGKSLAASTATVLILKYHASQIIFTGIAGAINPELRVGDIVVGNNFFYHDMDPRPIFPKFRVPYTDNNFFRADPEIFLQAHEAAHRFANNIKNTMPMAVLESFSITTPQVTKGTIATGDKFVTCSKETAKLANEIAELGEELHCIEMEGAAVAHICDNFNIGCAVIRTISDNADHNASVDFGNFLRSIAAHYSVGIVQEMLSA